MKLVVRKLQSLVPKQAPTTEEYAVILALLAIVCYATISAIGC
jgi:hypothetical protein